MVAGIQQQVKFAASRKKKINEFIYSVFFEFVKK